MDKHGDFPYLCWFTRGYLYDKQEIRTHHKKMKQWHTMKDNEPESSNMASLKPTSTWIYLKGSWRYAQLPQWLQIHSAKTLCDALPRIDVFQHALPAACLIQESENPNCQTSDFSGELDIYIYILYIYSFIRRHLFCNIWHKVIHSDPVSQAPHLPTVLKLFVWGPISSILCNSIPSTTCQPLERQ